MEKREVTLKVEGINIVGEIYFPLETGKQRYPTLCICHGIPAGRPPDPKDRGYPALAERFSNEGFLTMIFNFRGAGLSGGNLDFLGWTRDLEAVLDHLYALPEVDRSRFCLMGFSGGAAVSIYVSAHDLRVTSVVSCACPSEFGFLKGSPQSLIEHFRRIGLIRDQSFPPSVAEWWEGFQRISPLKWMDKIAPRPLLIVHGDQDEVVEINHAWTLYHKAREPKDIVIVKGGEHKLRLNESAMTKVLEWLKDKVQI